MPIHVTDDRPAHYLSVEIQNNPIIAELKIASEQTVLLGSNYTAFLQNYSTLTQLLSGSSPYSWMSDWGLRKQQMYWRVKVTYPGAVCNKGVNVVLGLVVVEKTTPGGRQTHKISKNKLTQEIMHIMHITSAQTVQNKAKNQPLNNCST